MRTLLTCLMALLVLSCSSPSVPLTKRVEKRVADTLRVLLDDPASYQPISTELKDSMTLEKQTSWILQSLYSDIKSTRSALVDVGFVDYPEFDTNAIARSYSLIEDRLEKLDKKKVLYYILEHQYRAKNKMGALIKSQLYVRTLGISDSIDVITDESDKAFKTGNFLYPDVQTEFERLSKDEAEKLYKIKLH